ncbi:MAG: hypothetical protein ACYDEV_00110 [Acidiferrobacter sp.]
MARLARWLGLLIGASVIMIMPAWAGQLITGLGGATLIVTESASNGQSQTAATLASPLNANGLRDAQLATVSPQNANSLGVIPADTLGTQSSTTTAASAVGSYLQPYLQAEAATLQQTMKGTRDAGAFYTYAQSVTVTSGTGTTSAQVTGMMWVPRTGPYQWMGTNATAGFATILYGQYQQSQSAYGLPSGWTMPNAGDFTWELLQVDLSGAGTTETAVPYQGTLNHTVATNGEYDAPLAIAATATTSAAIENCKASASDPALCNQPNPQGTYPASVNGQTVAYDPNTGYNYLVSNLVTPLMQQTGAVEAIVNYGRAVKPVYTNSTNGTQVAVVAAAVNTRTFSGGCGSATLANSGNIGYLLNETNDEYLIANNGVSSLVNAVSQSGLSPTQTFNQSASLPAGAQYSSYTSDIVNPFGGGQVYNWQNDTVNSLPASDYVYVAPLTQTTSQTNSQSSYTIPNGGPMVCIGGLTTYDEVWWNNDNYPFQSYSVYVNGQLIPQSSFSYHGWFMWFWGPPSIYSTILPYYAGTYGGSIYVIWPEYVPANSWLVLDGYAQAGPSVIVSDYPSGGYLWQGASHTLYF